MSLKAKTLFQLGPYQSLNYLLYQIGLRSGFFRLATPILDVNTLLGEEALISNWFLTLPDIKALLKINDIQAPAFFHEADTVLQKNMRFFGGSIQPLNLTREKEPFHWSRYETGSRKTNIEDIKYVWEPARFNWAITLGKAFYISGEEKYATTFWQLFEEFCQSNPPNKGLNWTSAQEVALRLIALVISAHLFKSSRHSTPQRLKSLSISIADHASRIPPTLCYAKAQNNNHLISEAVGLFTAAAFLPKHPQSAHWQDLGLKWFNKAITAQIAKDGTYIQHSTNYHRMLLMLALWMQLLLEKNNRVLDDHILNKLAAASEWLAARLDHISGRVPNLGHNDGSHILPFSNSAYYDYRPIVQASSRAFLAKPALPPGHWDDLCVWFDIPTQTRQKTGIESQKALKHLILGDQQDWAALRAVPYTSRPAHADQLHVDIWHQGANITLDAGTFQYNAPPPWENALTATNVHNTITINNLDQMTKAGKFLWLDWAQARIEEKTPNSITALHSGYSSLGILHRRTLRREKQNNWVILDELLPTQQSTQEIKAVLNWLLPDWPYKFRPNHITLDSPVGKIKLTIESSQPDSILEIYRAGVSLSTGQKETNLGWYSPTYGIKTPALSIQFTVFRTAPVQLKSTFHLSK